MKETEYGSMITPGSWVESNLLAVIDRLTFRHWVMQGARQLISGSIGRAGGAGRFRLN